MTRRLSLASAAVLAVSLAACGGGSSALPAAPAAGTQPSARVTAKASATIVIPAPARAGSANARAPRWISPSTQSVQIDATRSDGFAEGQTTAVNVGSSNCTQLPTGARQCAVDFVAPVTTGTQTDEITVYLIDNVDPNFGYNLAVADVFNQTVTPGAANTFAFVMGGIVGAQIATPQPSPATVTHGAPATITVPISVTDFRGNPIVGLLDSPLKLTLSDTTSFSFASPAAQPDGSVTITDTSATQFVNLNYNGGTVPTTLTIATTSFESARIASGATTGFSTPLTITPQ
jgi:hypothetical protein